MYSRSLLFASLLLGSSSARDVPAGLRAYYNSIVSQGQCSNVLKSGFLSIDDGDDSYSYCADDSKGILYLQGTGGNLANMDIDCDGIKDGIGDDGRCDSSGDIQYQTAFMDTVAGYSNGVEDLNPFVHDYVVFGNYGSEDGYITFDPEEYGIEPLSVMAVVCGDKLIYGVWGDTNGDDGNSLIGETSLSLATKCFGGDMNGDNGHDEQDVLYIAFQGPDAVPGEQVNWRAGSEAEFQSSLQSFGDALVSRFEN